MPFVQRPGSSFHNVELGTDVSLCWNIYMRIYFGIYRIGGCFFKIR